MTKGINYAPHHLRASQTHTRAVVFVGRHNAAYRDLPPTRRAIWYVGRLYPPNLPKKGQKTALKATSVEILHRKSQKRGYICTGFQKNCLFYPTSALEVCTQSKTFFCGWGPQKHERGAPRFLMRSIRYKLSLCSHRIIQKILIS